ncbi:hypothetical protein CTI12_AA399530 [Artemisia annua]|uniref:Uncharacterized protein n=1 Tax=Artemisia annua TaxID=35608 RepID=A0A2U1MBE3_ARTAN|nr:hypothetical protein CTI12_AA399530 [Artemisia annua]
MALSLSSIPGTKFDPTDFQLVKLYESAAKGQNYDFLRLLDVSADHPAKLFAV